MNTPKGTSIYDHQRIFRELATHPLYAIDEDQAAWIYEINKLSWGSREVSDGHLQHILETYAQVMEKAYLKALAVRLHRLGETLPNEQPLRVLELGGANAAFLHWWRAHGGGTVLRYTGIETYKPFVDHVNAHFPEAEMIHGDAEAFADMDFSGRPPFGAFVASTVFCMIHPSAVRRCILTAAQHTDNIFVRDFLINIQGAIRSDGVLAFDYYQDPHRPMMFAHRFGDYFAEAGFSLVEMIESRTPQDGPGWGIVHVRRPPR